MTSPAIRLDFFVLTCADTTVCSSLALLGMCLSAMDFCKTDEELNSSCRQIIAKRRRQRKRKILTVYEKLQIQKRLATRAISRKYRPRSGHRRRMSERCVAVRSGGVGVHYVPTSPLGAMAPGNTTQYLMNLVYQDFCTSERLTAVQPAGYSPMDMQTSLDNDAYDLSLDFQQRDFESMLCLISGCFAC